MADVTETYTTNDLVATDYVIDTTVDNVADITDRQTDEISQVVTDSNAQVTTLIEERSYEEKQLLENLARDTATATADELERRGQEEQAEGGASAALGATRSEGPTTVVLDSTQWQYVHDSLALQNTSAVLSLAMLCAVLGSNLASRFIERWRS